MRAEQNIPLRMNYTPETTNTQLIQKVSTIPLINNTIYKLNPATQNIFNSIIQSKNKNNYEKILSLIMLSIIISCKTQNNILKDINDLQKFIISRIKS